jgi:hypothetical protein
LEASLNIILFYHTNFQKDILNLLYTIHNDLNIALKKILKSKLESNLTFSKVIESPEIIPQNSRGLKSLVMPLRNFHYF